MTMPWSACQNVRCLLDSLLTSRLTGEAGLDYQLLGNLKTDCRPMSESNRNLLSRPLNPESVWLFGAFALGGLLCWVITQGRGRGAWDSYPRGRLGTAAGGGGCFHTGLWEVQGPSSTPCGALGRECDHRLSSTWSIVWLQGPRHAEVVTQHHMVAPPHGPVATRGSLGSGGADMGTPVGLPGQPT